MWKFIVLAGYLYRGTLYFFIKDPDRGKRNLKKKIKYLKYCIKNGNMTSKDAQKYLAGHLGYIKSANVYNLTNKLFYR